ncbi:MAG: NAD(P)/FAD-dependent oxidoreductase [Elusimicrobiales bacterium]
MKYEFDIIVIGLGPAGMAVSVMGAEMGLRVCAIEKNKIGGECMNVGCIPSKGLLQSARVRHLFSRAADYGLEAAAPPRVLDTQRLVRGHLKYINDNKTSAMFSKVRLVLGEGAASFVDPHTVAVGERRFTAKRIFVCVGTRPALPPVPGLESVEPLTNENLFDLDEVPPTLAVLGGGAIGVEMAQAFARLGSEVTLLHMDSRLLPNGDTAGGAFVEEIFAGEKIKVLNGRSLKKAEKTSDGVLLITDRGEEIRASRLLVGAGRRQDLAGLKLENAGVAYDKRGVKVDDYLRTTAGHIYAPGDCNGHFLLSHAAMHQGMLALMNCMLPWPLKRNFKSYPVPWTVFCDPNISAVGLCADEIKAKGIAYETVESRYGDYGAAIAERLDRGFVRVYTTKTGRILGAVIAGEGSAEMINEWALAIQKGLRMHDIMMTMHSFPSMSFLCKRVAETWMMNRVRPGWVKNLIRAMF